MLRWMIRGPREHIYHTGTAGQIHWLHWPMLTGDKPMWSRYRTTKAVSLDRTRVWSYMYKEISRLYLWNKVRMGWLCFWNSTGMEKELLGSYSNQRSPVLVQHASMLPKIHINSLASNQYSPTGKWWKAHGDFLLVCVSLLTAHLNIFYYQLVMSSDEYTSHFRLFATWPRQLAKILCFYTKKNPSLSSSCRIPSWTRPPGSCQGMVLSTLPH